MSWADKYPHNVNASVLLLDDEIYNWKIGNQYWEDPSMVKMYFSDFSMVQEGRFKVENTSFLVNNDLEHEEAFIFHSREWFKQWKISEKRVGSAPY